MDVSQTGKDLPRAMARHQPGSEPGWREATKVRSRVEHVSRGGREPRKLCASRGPDRANRPEQPAPRVREARTVSGRWHAACALGRMARPGGGPRGRRPAHGDTGRTRERGRASSASCRDSADQGRAGSSAGSPPRAHRSPWQGPPPRRVDRAHPTRGRQGRRDEGERAGTPAGREAVCADHRSDGIEVADSTRPRENAEAPPACGDVSAGGAEVGQPGNQRRPWDLGQRRGSRASSPHQGGTNRGQPARAGASAREAHPATTGTERHAGPRIPR